MLAGVSTCPGALIVHASDGSIAGCTYDDEPEGCAGRDARHEGDQRTCLQEQGSCAYCGVVQP